MEETEVPETHVLAIASHVTSGYVGNTMATFCLQALGCEVSAIHTVNYSNHVGYRTFTGRRTPPSEILTLHTGLLTAHLTTYSILLTGYCPTTAVVRTLGTIARERRQQTASTPGAFFWVLDPVMGDNGRVYVEEGEVEVYRELVAEADLVLPNAFEAELLSGVRIVDLASLKEAVRVLHRVRGVPHVVVTSVRLPAGKGQGEDDGMLTVLGSSATAAGEPRFFRLRTPALPVFFSGTGDMFAALLTGRLRQMCAKDGLLGGRAWRSADGVRGGDLPLARAAELVLRSMRVVLGETAGVYERVERELGAVGEGLGEEERHLRLTRAAEVRVVRHVGALRVPPVVEGLKVEGLEG